MLQLNYKREESLAPFPPLVYTCKCKDALCNFTKAMRAAEELANATAETSWNGCAGDGTGGGEGLQSTDDGGEGGQGVDAFVL